MHVRPRWFPLIAGVIQIIPAIWMAAVAFGAVWHGHPALPITLGVAAALGTALIVLSFRRRRSPSRHPGPRLTGAIIWLVLALAVSGTLVWLTPFSAAPAAVAAMAGNAQVTVMDTATTIELRPRSANPTVGLVFSPGARVDARAYVGVLMSQAEAGFLDVILIIPYGLGIVDIGQSAGPITDHPEIARWVVGGHSLGGTSASMFAARRPGGGGQLC